MTIVYTPENLTLSQSDIFQQFSHTFTFRDQSPTGQLDPQGNPIYTYQPITEYSVVPKIAGLPYYENTVTITTTGVGTTLVTTTIAGEYREPFDQSYWQYQTYNGSPIVTTHKFEDIPEHIFGLTKYQPDFRRLIWVYFHFTVNGTAVVYDKAIQNNWDYGRNLIQVVNARGDVR